MAVVDTGTYPAQLRAPRLAPGWPVYTLIFGLPLWWFLGLGSLIWPVFAIPMALWLWRQPDVRAPRRFGLWILFVAWVFASVTQLTEGGQLISFGYRLALYISAGIIMLYVYNLDQRALPQYRVVQMAAALWAMTIAGGFAALLWPTFSMTSLTQSLLPARLAAHPFLYDLVHLRFSQFSVILEYPVPRPTAPFAYTNDWGSMVALLTPMYMLWLFRTRRPLVRLGGFVLLLAAAIPIVESLNRGLWLSLGVTLAYAIIRLAMRGNARQLAAVGFLMMFVAGVFYFSPLPQIVSDRLATPHSNDGRISIYEGAADGAMASPLLGYGTTRPQDETAGTGGRQVGTHGQLWLVLFSHGFPGLILFTAWLLLLFWRTRPADMTDRFYVHLVIFAAIVQMPYYGLVPAQIQVIMLLAGAVLRPEVSATVIPTRRAAREAVLV